MSEDVHDRDSALLVEAFYSRIESDMADTTLVSAIRARQDEISAAADEPPDNPARYNLRYTSAILAAYQVCREREIVPPANRELIDWLTSAFVEPCAEHVNAATRSMLDDAADPFAVMTDYARRTESEQYGVEFHFEHGADDADRLHIDVRRCGYHEFFRRHAAPELTPVLCAFDANWFEAIDPHEHGFVFSRDTTIGRGGPLCPFHFRRVERG